MLKLYICPECGWIREVSRRKEVECHKCGQKEMVLTKLVYDQYATWAEEERVAYSKRWLYLHEIKKENMKNMES